MIDGKKQDVKGGANPVVAAVTGAVVGAGVAVAGAVALKDEKNRKKVKEVLSNVKDQALEYMENKQKTAEDKKGEVEEKIAEGKKEVKRVATSAKGSKKALHTK